MFDKLTQKCLRIQISSLVLIFALAIPANPQKVERTLTDFPFTLIKSVQAGVEGSGIDLYVLLEERHFSRSNLRKLFDYYSGLYDDRDLSVSVFSDKEMLLWYERGTRANYGYVVTEEGRKAEQEFYEKAFPPPTGYFSAFYVKNGLQESFRFNPLKTKSPFVYVTFRDGRDLFKGKDSFLNAVKYGYFELVERGISIGQDLNARDEEGGTALSWSIWLFQNEIARLLINSKADVNIADLDGVTPLMLGVQAENYEGVKLLIDAKADVNVVSRNGETVLMLAASGCQENMIRLLIDNKAVRSIKDKTGKTAADRSCDNPGIRRLLTQ